MDSARASRTLKSSSQGYRLGALGSYLAPTQGTHPRGFEACCKEPPLGWSLGCLLVACWDFNCLGFYGLHNFEVVSLTFWRGSEVSQGKPRAPSRPVLGGPG